MSIFKILVNHNKKDSFVNQFRQKRFDYLKNRIEKFIPEASAVLGDGSRIDRYIQIDSDGGFHLTTENVMAVQSEALPVLDQFDDDDVFYILHCSIFYLLLL